MLCCQVTSESSLPKKQKKKKANGKQKMKCIIIYYTRQWYENKNDQAIKKPSQNNFFPTSEFCL